MRQILTTKAFWLYEKKPNTVNQHSTELLKRELYVVNSNFPQKYDIHEKKAHLKDLKTNKNRKTNKRLLHSKGFSAFPFHFIHS